MLRKKLALLAALALCAVLTGCAFSTSAEELYRLPKLPTEYESLEKQIDLLLANGMEHTSPMTGANLQSVQMVDLDGDGAEEAVAFFVRATDAKPMKVYIFKAQGESYEQYALIEGTASSLYSIAYNDLNNDGRREILIGYKSGSGLQVLSVFSLADGEPELLLSTVFSRYVLSDLDDGGRQELVVFRSSDAGGCLADCYAWNENEIELRSTVELSFAGAELKYAAEGRLSDGVRAVLATGVADNVLSVTDILVLQNGVLHNVAPGTGSRFDGLYPGDVNMDGFAELPEPIPYPAEDGEAESYCRINWRQYASDGTSQVVYRSFYDAQDGWSLALPKEWDENVTVERTVSADETAVMFCEWKNGARSDAFLAIRTVTGASRELRGEMGDRFILAQQADTVYSGELLKTDTKIQKIMDEQRLYDSFSLITGSWTAEEADGVDTVRD